MEISLLSSHRYLGTSLQRLQHGFRVQCSLQGRFAAQPLSLKRLDPKRVQLNGLVGWSMDLLCKYAITGALVGHIGVVCILTTFP